MGSILTDIPKLFEIPTEKHWINDPVASAQALYPRYEDLFWRKGSLFLPERNNSKFDVTGELRSDVEEITCYGTNGEESREVTKNEDVEESLELQCARLILCQLVENVPDKLVRGDLNYTYLVHRRAERDSGLLDTFYPRSRRLVEMKRIASTFKLLALTMGWKCTWDTTVLWSAKDLKLKKDRLLGIFDWLLEYCRDLFNIKVYTNVGTKTLCAMLNCVLMWWCGCHVGTDDETGKMKLVDTTDLRELTPIPF